MVSETRGVEEGGQLRPGVAEAAQGVEGQHLLQGFLHVVAPRDLAHGLRLAGRCEKAQRLLTGLAGLSWGGQRRRDEADGRRAGVLEQPPVHVGPGQRHAGPSE